MMAYKNDGKLRETICHIRWVKVAQVVDYWLINFGKMNTLHRTQWP